MAVNLFEYDSYKKYLTDIADLKPRGFRKSLAEATHCHTAYISHVLNGAGQLNLEQVEACARFLELSKDETHFLLTLVEFNRAGTPSLRQIFRDQLGELRERHLMLRKRLGIQKSLSRENQAVYYSSWHYAAVHVATSVPSLRTRAALIRALKLSARKLDQTLEFLITVGLIDQKGDKFFPGTMLLHLEKDSPFIVQHHSNWRSFSIAQMGDQAANEAIHYSTVLSISAEDVQNLRAWISKNIGEWGALIQKSKEEQVYCLGLDFFRLDRQG